MKVKSTLLDFDGTWYDCSGIAAASLRTFKKDYSFPK